jgi:hypothetical protein
MNSFATTKAIATSIIIIFLTHQTCKAQNRSITLKISTYKSKTKTQQNEIVIDDVAIRKSKGITSSTAKRITKSLHETAQKNYLAALSSCNYQPNDLWDYEVKFKNAFHVNNYLSIISEKYTNCAGNPAANKISKTYSTFNGDEISADSLLGTYFNSPIKKGNATGEGRIYLTKEAVDTLIAENNEKLTPDVKSSCQKYLKKMPYTIWIEPGRLILQPLFSQLKSECQNDYSINFEK